MLLCLNHAHIRIVPLLEDVEHGNLAISVMSLAVGSVFLAHSLPMLRYFCLPCHIGGNGGDFASLA